MFSLDAIRAAKILAKADHFNKRQWSDLHSSWELQEAQAPTGFQAVFLRKSLWQYRNLEYSQSSHTETKHSVYSQEGLSHTYDLGKELEPSWAWDYNLGFQIWKTLSAFALICFA